jgi:hypothetical protein
MKGVLGMKLTTRLGSIGWLGKLSRITRDLTLNNRDVGAVLAIHQRSMCITRIKLERKYQLSGYLYNIHILGGKWRIEMIE